MFNLNKSLNRMVGRKMQIPKLISAKRDKFDYDGDGIINSRDCQPRNLLRQDNVQLVRPMLAQQYAAKPGWQQNATDIYQKPVQVKYTRPSNVSDMDRNVYQGTSNVVKPRQVEIVSYVPRQITLYPSGTPREEVERKVFQGQPYVAKNTTYDFLGNPKTVETSKVFGSAPQLSTRTSFDTLGYPIEKQSFYYNKTGGLTGSEKVNAMTGQVLEKSGKKGMWDSIFGR